MLERLFSRKKEEVIKAPLQGKIIKIEEVPDPTFSEKMIGEGVAIIPSEGNVVSPVKGEIIQLFPTKHAIGIRSESGLEILIHIGLETVLMKGEGFTANVKQGDKVNAGDSLIDFSLELVKEKAKSVITPIVVTNGDQIDYLEMENHEEAKLNETPVMKLRMK
ncbi:PTS sugar transporter subunit IIA [Pseudalkalibacillus decolorationis]|uniref:PTS sugar transporter subunit IIA n=1 Tax=Pseudalkalibacillus decolorationis TaxID=163879 RepID=UPI0021487319|nr:PTS glucose transporter subunit IIA [Pseudalkalibacillus decolorationis]